MREDSGAALRGHRELKPLPLVGEDLPPRRGIFKFFVGDDGEGGGESVIIDKTVAQFMHVTFVNRNVNVINRLIRH